MYSIHIALLLCAVVAAHTNTYTPQPFGRQTPRMTRGCSITLAYGFPFWSQGTERRVFEERKGPQQALHRNRGVNWVIEVEWQ